MAETWLTRFLHNQIVNAMQRRLQAEGMQMVILPMPMPSARWSGASAEVL